MCVAAKFIGLMASDASELRNCSRRFRRGRILKRKEEWKRSLVELLLDCDRLKKKDNYAAQAKMINCPLHLFWFNGDPSGLSGLIKPTNFVPLLVHQASF